jgi:hypothetical protein
MAHFAEIKTLDNIVIRVVVVSNNDVTNNGGELSTAAENWVYNNIPKDPIILSQYSNIYPQTYWKQCSYNNKFRKQYPGIGDVYDSLKNKFIKERPYPSWSLNVNDDWQAPIALPTINSYTYNNINYEYVPVWDENNNRWICTNVLKENYYWNTTSLNWIKI